MPKITSHTIVKNGMPFIGLVLRQVEPLMTRMIISVGFNSIDGTMGEILRFTNEYKDKVFVEFEQEKNFGALTNTINRQVTRTKTEWIMRLDDDDYWCRDDLKAVLDYIDKHGNDYDGFSVSPYQMIDFKSYDASWLDKKSLSKFLKNQSGLHNRGNFPKDVPYLNDKSLYWKKNPRMKRLPYRFYHLPLMKYNSFREGKYKYSIGNIKQFK